MYPKNSFFFFFSPAFFRVCTSILCCFKVLYELFKVLYELFKVINVLLLNFLEQRSYVTWRKF